VYYVMGAETCCNNLARVTKAQFSVVKIKNQLARCHSQNSPDLSCPITHMIFKKSFGSNTWLAHSLPHSETHSD